MTTVKGKTPSLLTKSAGRPSVRIAGQKRSCSRCGAVISKGEKCVEVPSPQLHGPRRTFCPSCFYEVSKQTLKDLLEVVNQVRPSGSEVRLSDLAL